MASWVRKLVRKTYSSRIGIRRRLVIDCILIPVLVYLGLAFYGFFFAERHIFKPHPCTYPDTPDLFRLPTRDGVTLVALYKKNPEADFTILYSHGNSEDLGDVRPAIDELVKLGFSVLAYDYRGYGLSSGKPSTRGACVDVETVYRHAVETLKIPPERLLVYGRSLGGGPSCHLAAREPVAGLMLESTFTSTFVVVTRVRILPFDCFPNLSLLGSIHCPILVMHGTADRVVPWRHGKKLFDAAGEPKRFLWLDDVSHNAFPGEHREAYNAAVLDFVKLVQSAEKNRGETGGDAG